MTRHEIKKIFKRNKGAVAETSRRASVTSQAVSLWLAGRSTSKNVSDKAEAYAIELLAKEDADLVAKGIANGPSVRNLVEKLRSSGAE